MGYYTYYSLEVKEPDRYSDIERALGVKSGYSEDTLFTDSQKWYSHESDCIAVSREFPEVTFAIKGIGEEQSNVWRRKYFGGCQIEILRSEPFKFPPL